MLSIKILINACFGSHYFLVCSIIICYLIHPLSGKAQTEDSTFLDNQGITLQQVLENTERTYQLYNEVEKLHNQLEIVDQMELSIPSTKVMTDSLTTLLRDTTHVLTVNQFNNVERNWSKNDKKVREWNQVISNRVETLQGKKSEIGTFRKIWDITMDYAQDQELTPDLLESMAHNLALLTKADSLLSASLKNTLRINIQLASLLTSNSMLGNMIEARRQLMINEIWVPETPPIWSNQTDTVKVSILRQVQENYAERKGLISDYRLGTPTYQYFLLLFLLINFTVLIYSRLSAKKLGARYPQEIKDIKFILRYPLISSVFIAWLATQLIFDAPIEAEEMMEMIMVIPISVIIYHAFDTNRLSKTFTFVILSLVFNVLPLFSHTWLHRHLVLGVAVISLCTLLLIKNVVNKGELVILTHSLTRFLVQCFTIIIAGAIIANVIGSVRLSQLLLLGFIGSLIIGFVAFVAIFILMDIITLVMLSSFLSKSNIVTKFRPVIRNKFKKVLTVIGSLWVLYVTLELFSIRQTTTRWILDFVSTPIVVGEMSISLANILLFFLTILISIWLSRLIILILDQEVFDRTDRASEGLQGAITLIIKYAVITIGVVIAFGAAGIPFDKMTIMLSAFGVGIGFGLQNIFNNLVSGLILALERPIEVSDVVEVSSLMGVVKKIGFRASMVRTFEGADVIVPNGDLISNQMINWTHSDRRRRLTLNVGVEYGSDPKKVLQVLLESVEDHPGVLKKPAPIPRFIGFGDSSLDFQLLFWIPDFERSFSIGTEVTTLVHDHLKKANINIPFPQRDLYIKDIPKEQAPPTYNQEK